LKFRQINRKVEIDKSHLREYLVFLVDRSLIQKRKTGYVVTERGHSVLKVLSKLVKEAARIEVQNYEAISSTLEKATFTYKKA
jgi:predicted transcriptional regulator